MKCPKCGFISFDYNQVCPKCNKDISAEQVRMNLPPFRPDPPSLLGALTGEANESGALRIDTSSVMAVADEEEVSLDESVAPESEEIVLDEARELDISLEPEDLLSHPETEDEKEESSLDLDDLTIEEIEELEPEKEPIIESFQEEREELEIDFDDLSIDEIEPQEQADSEEAQEALFDEAEMVTLEMDRKKLNIMEKMEESELELELDLEKTEDE